MLPHIVSSNPKMPRDYAKEYRTYDGKPKQIKRRDARNKARALMEKKGASAEEGRAARRS